MPGNRKPSRVLLSPSVAGSTTSGSHRVGGSPTTTPTATASQVPPLKARASGRGARWSSCPRFAPGHHQGADEHRGAHGQPSDDQHKLLQRTHRRRRAPRPHGLRVDAATSLVVVAVIEVADRLAHHRAQRLDLLFEAPPDTPERPVADPAPSPKTDESGRSGQSRRTAPEKIAHDGAVTAPRQQRGILNTPGIRRAHWDRPGGRTRRHSELLSHRYTRVASRWVHSRPTPAPARRPRRGRQSAGTRAAPPTLATRAGTDCEEAAIRWRRDRASCG